ncbi:MAG: CAP domain-containing protein [Lachnospiraceae bacterium]|nr:CAP domain-containing protein [Lachnospiraceae bacterium]
MAMLACSMAATALIGCSGETEGQTVQAEDDFESEEILEDEGEKEEEAVEPDTDDVEEIDTEAYSEEEPKAGEGESAEETQDATKSVQTDDSEAAVSAEAEVSSAVEPGTAAAAVSTSSFTPPYTYDEMYAVYLQGDIERYNQMMSEYEAAYESYYGADTSAAVSGQGSGGGTETTVELSRDFVDYLNGKRSEAGLSELIWDSSMEETALERAQELVTDLSHSGMRNCTGEIIQSSTSSSVAVWYDAFYNSATHRSAMLSQYNGRAAAAVCRAGNMYYVVVMFGI